MKANYDFTHGKRGAVVANPLKQKISIRFDPKVLDWFKHQVEEKGGGSYQALMNKVLLEYVEREGEPLEKIFRKVLREELSYRQTLINDDSSPKQTQHPKKHHTGR